MLADRVDGESDAGNREHGGNDAVGRHGRSPGVGGRKVHGHLVDGNRADQAQVNLIRHVPIHSFIHTIIIQRSVPITVKQIQAHTRTKRTSNRSKDGGYATCILTCLDDVFIHLQTKSNMKEKNTYSDCSLAASGPGSRKDEAVIIGKIQKSMGRSSVSIISGIVKRYQ